MTNKFNNYGKTYGPETLAEVQKDFERARLGSSFASKERTKTMVNAINAEQQRRRENSK